MCPFAGPVAQEIHEREQPQSCEPDDAAAIDGVPGAISVRLDDRVPHLVAKVGGVEPEEESEPALRQGQQEAAFHFAAFPRSPPIRAARISASRRRTSAFAARTPASVMR